MYKNTLIQNLTSYLNKNPNSSFHQKSLEHLNLVKYENNGLLLKIPHNQYILESIKMLICQESEKYNFYIYNKNKKNCSNYVVKIPEDSKEFIFNFLNFNTRDIDFNIKTNNLLVNFIIADKEMKFKNKYFQINKNTIRTICNLDFSKILINPDNFDFLFLIKKIFGYSFVGSWCIPNLIVQNDKLIVYNEKAIDKLYQKMQQNLLKNYRLKVSIDEIETYFNKCNIYGFDIYKGTPEWDKDTSLIKKFHLDVKRKIYEKYCRNINMLFDVGCGRLTDIFYWNENNIKNVHCIEPSKDSINSGQQKYEKVKNQIKTKILVVEGLGDINWNDEEKYKKFLNQTYDVITFQFTIHYMINNIDILMKNIRTISKPKTKIIITCMNGNLILEDLKKDDIIVRNKNENHIIFAISKYSDDDILVYLKGGYGMENGSIERIVETKKLIQKFKENNYQLIEEKNFLNYNSKYKDQMNSEQKKVSYYYTSLIFEYK